MLLYRPTEINQGAVSSVDATTEPRPRLTNRIGSVQQINVAIDDDRLTIPASRSLNIPPFGSPSHCLEPTPDPRTVGVILLAELVRQVTFLAANYEYVDDDHDHRQR